MLSTFSSRAARALLRSGSLLAIFGSVHLALDLPHAHSAHAAAPCAEWGEHSARSHLQAEHAHGREHGDRTRSAASPAPGTSSNVPSAVAADAADAKQWTCPMHPEIIRDAPGKCPLCGMKLVEKKPSAGQG